MNALLRSSGNARGAEQGREVNSMLRDTKEAGSKSVYRFNNQDAVIHYFGAYVQLSTRSEHGAVNDYLLSPRSLSLAYDVKSERVQVGVDQQFYREAGRFVDAPKMLGETQRKVWKFYDEQQPMKMREVPIYETNTTRTRKYTDLFGTPIQVGDAVKSFGLGNNPSGNIQALTEHYVMIDDIYVPWSIGVTYQRA